MQIGGGVRVGDAFQSDCRTEIHSDMGNGGTMSEFLESGAFVSRRFEQEKQTSVTGVVSEAVPHGRVWLNGLDTA